MPFKDKKYYLDGETLTAQELDFVIQNNVKIDLTELAW